VGVLASYWPFELVFSRLSGPHNLIHGDMTDVLKRSECSSTWVAILSAQMQQKFIAQDLTTRFGLRMTFRN
jgi:hypothetical protein